MPNISTIAGNILHDSGVNLDSLQPILTNPVTGTGSSGTVPKFTGTSTLGNSLITDNGSNALYNGSILATQAWISQQGYVTGGPFVQNVLNNSGDFDLNVSGQQAFFRFSQGQWVNGPVSGNYSHVLSVNGAADNRTVQIYLGDVPGYVWWRPNQGGTWHPWERILTSNNYNSYAPTLSGGGASGTWSISISGNADSVDGYHATNAANGLAYYASNGYLYVPSWINVDGGGVFSNTNNAHLRPNSGSYGSWLVTGSRNSWRGFEFDSGNNGNVVLMIHTSSNTTGFHNNSYGWQFYWESGSLYVLKNAYGGGTQAVVLDSSNYNSYAPTLTGGGASGTWSINITGSAGSASSVAWSGVSSGYRNNYDIGFRPADNSSSYAGFKFATPGNDADAGYFLIRGGADSDVYTQDGITLVADKGWLTLAQRTQSDKGVRIMTGASSTTRLSIASSGISTFSGLVRSTVTDEAFRAQSDGTSTAWRGRVGSFNATADKSSFLGNYTGRPGVFGHNDALTAWAELYVNTLGVYGHGTLYLSWDTYVKGNGNDTNYPILHSGNYNSYAPTLTGGGASGTWGINITGNASSANYTQLLDDVNNYTWSSSSLPQDFSLGMQLSFVGPNAGEGSWQNYGTIINARTYAGGGGSLQIYVPYGPNNGGPALQVRFGDYSAPTYGNQWTAWKTLLQSDNYNSYAPTLTGGGASGTWSINITGSAGSAGNADTVDGYHASTSNIGNYIVVRDGNGYIFGNYINMTDDGNPGGGTSISSFITKQGDNYYRSVSPTNAMVSIRGVASGSWGINITGDANTVDGVDSSQIVYGGSGRASNSDSNMNDTNQKSGFYYYNNPTGQPYAEWWNWITIAGNGWQSSNNYEFQLAHAFHGDDFYVRRMTNGTAYSWRYILTNANYNSYAPTLTGGGASGTWSINISGNSATVGGYSPIIAYGGNNVRGRVLVADSSSGNISTQNPELYSGEVRLGAAWDRGGVYASSTLSLSTSASEIHFVFSNATKAYFNSSGNLFLGQGTGASSIYMGDSDEGQREIHCNSNRIGFLTQAGSWGAWLYDGADWEAASSIRAPIFYDSDNTGYYANFADTGTSINIAGSLNAATYNKPGLLLNSSGTSSSGAAFGMQQVTGEGWTGIFVDFEPYTGWGFYHDNPNNYFSFTAEDSTGQIRSFTVPSRSSGNRTAYEKFRVDQNNGDIVVGRTGTAQSDFRAPIFYDSANTGYYCDPASESNLWRFTAQSMTRNAINYLSINSPYSTRAGQSSPYLNGTMGWGTTDFNTIGSYWGSGFIDTWSNPGNAPGGSSHYVGIQAMHYNDQNGNFHGWQMACAQEATNRWFWRSSWNIPNRPWVEMIHSGNISSQQVQSLNSSNFIAQRGTFGNWNADFENTPAGTLTYGGDLGANGSNGPGGSWWMQQNFRHTNVNNYWGIQVAWGWEDNANRLATRNVTGGSYGGWVYYLNSSNFTSYIDAPNKAGTSYYQTNTWMQFNGNFGLYWPSYYGAHFYPNDGSSYTQFRLNGNKNGYGGIWDSYSAVAGIMYDSSGNGGVYREANGLWYFYYHVGNNCMGVGTSTTSSSYKMYVNGTVYATGDVIAYSDRRKKTNIETIKNALEKVTSLRGVFYDKIGEEDKERKTGVIAQEVYEVLPEVVTYAADVDEYGVSYGNMSGVLIEAIKEQNVLIKTLRSEIDELKAKLV